MTRTRIKLDKRGRVVESEASIQKSIVDFLEAHGFMVFTNRSGYGGKIAAFVTPQQAGSPDLFVWGVDHAKYKPVHFAVECKRKGGKMSDAQVEWSGRYCNLGFNYVLAYSHEDVERFLKGNGWL